MSDTDDIARERASDPRLSVLLQAPAGSGKTTVLTRRFLRLLAEVDEPEQILAITFTRKAAAEMRERVLKALRSPIPDDAPEAEKLRSAVAAATARSQERGWNLLDNPGRLRIQTIDSFNFWLASQLPLAARVGGTLAVADRPWELYQRAARATLIEGERDPELAADIHLLFERVDNNFMRTQRLLADMLQKRGHWLRFVVQQSPEALRKRIADSLVDIVGDRLREIVPTFPSALRRECERIAQIGPLGEKVEHLENWKRLAGLLLTKEGTVRKIAPRLPDWDTGSREILKGCIELASRTPSVQDVLRDLALLPSPSLADADAKAIEALSRILHKAAGYLQLEFAATGRVDHTYVAGAAREALTDAGLPTDLALRSGLALRHILVDEFQDTSLAQFDLLEALTVGWEEGDGRTLFVVGDPMQSIYQFREAEVGLFLRARDRGIGNVRLEPLKLVRNFRSVPSLIDEINSIFLRLFPEHDDLRASAVAFTPSVAARDTVQERPLEVSLFGAEDRAEEAAAIAQRVVELRQLNPAATIAVLVAARTHAPPVMSALIDGGVPVVGVDLVPLGELPVIRDLAALVRALHHLGDRISWLTILRAPWCGLTLASLTALSRGDSFVWEAMWDEERILACADQDRERLARVRGVLDAALSTRGQTSLAEWIETTWIRLGAPDAYSPDDLLEARTFFRMLGERTASGEWKGPEDLDALVADLYAEPRSSDPNPVQVMTIHRAKGLEFDHVFLPALDRDRNKGPEPLLRWLDLPRASDGSDLIMAPMPAVGADNGDQLNAYLKRLMNEREAHEQVRLLYVAATRARQSLHLSAAPKPRPDGSIVPRTGTLLSYLWPALGEAFIASAKGSTLSLPLKRVSHPLRRLRGGWVPNVVPRAPEYEHLPLAHQSLEPIEFSWVGETARHIGTVVHRALERFGKAAELPRPEDIAAQRETFAHQLRRLGVPGRDIEEAAGFVVDALSRTVVDRLGRWIFSPDHRDASSELALTGLANGVLTNVVIDRSFIDAEGNRWLIDFKTSRHEGGALDEFIKREMERYHAQLSRYVELARNLGPEPVRAALYFPFLGILREL